MPETPKPTDIQSLPPSDIPLSAIASLPLEKRLMVSTQARMVLQEEIKKGPLVDTGNFLNAVDRLGATISDDLPQGRVLLESLGKFPQVYVFACNAIGDNLKQAYKDSDTKEILHNLDRAHLLGITSQPKLAPLVIALEKKFRPKEEVKAAETEVAGAAGAAITLPSATSEETKPDALASLGIRPTATKPAPEPAAPSDLEPVAPEPSTATPAFEPGDPMPEVEKPLAEQLKEIDSSITDRHILGKFKHEIILHGQSMKGGGDAGDYMLIPTRPLYKGEYGYSNDMEDLDPTDQLSGLKEFIRLSVIEHSTTGTKGILSNCHTLGYIKDKNHPQQAIACLIYPHCHSDASGRPSGTMEVILRMPEEKLVQLLNKIRKNPDALELFYQTATNGLDSSVNRYIASQVAIVDAEHFIPLAKFSPYQTRSTNSTVHGPYYHPERLDSTAITLLNYSKPYGQVDMWWRK